MSFTDPAPGATRGRIDQGVDWSNVRSIVAVAAGRIVQVFPALSGFGQTIIERLGSGQEVYYAEETAGGTATVAPGQLVQAGQQVASGQGGAIEVGFWDSATGHAQGYQPGVTSGAPTAAGQAFSSMLSGRRSPTSSAATSNVPNYVPAKYVPWVQSAAQGTGLPAAVVAAQIKDESGFDPNATSDTGAEGIAQIEPKTWKGLGISGSPYSPQDALQGYTSLMSSLLSQYNGNIRNALAAYNAGSGNIQAGYGYADSILSAAGLSSSATAGSSSATSITRPGGQPSGQAGNAQGIEQVFSNYENLLNQPRQAPPGIAASLGGNPVTAPFRWFWSSFTGNWQQVDQGQGPAGS